MRLGSRFSLAYACKFSDKLSQIGKGLLLQFVVMVRVRVRIRVRVRVRVSVRVRVRVKVRVIIRFNVTV